MPRRPTHTPIERELLTLEAIALELADLRFMVSNADSPLAVLKVVHDSAEMLAVTRTAFADLKGLACLEANEAGWSYPQIADALSCSEPYVQQMVYRGRKVRNRT